MSTRDRNGYGSNDSSSWTVEWREPAAPDWTYPTVDDFHLVVVINNEYAALHMEVCAENGATDAEILEACNSSNKSPHWHSPWDTVVRESDYHEFRPWDCDEEHTHFYVSRKL